VKTDSEKGKESNKIFQNTYRAAIFAVKTSTSPALAENEALSAIYIQCFEHIYYYYYY